MIDPLPFHLNRRCFLGSAAFGLSSLTGVSRVFGSAGSAGRAKRVLVIYEQGGLSHMDTWDPKPEGPSDHRSPFKPADTNVPGIRFTELLSKTARVADKLAIVRSMCHARSGADAHPNGTQYALSGSHPSATPFDMPDIGSIVAHVQESTCKYLPPYIMVPGNHEQAAETRHGFLPAGRKVFKTGGRDVSDPNWKIDALLPRSENVGVRLSNRHDLRNLLDQQTAKTSASSDARGITSFYDQAVDMLTSPQVAKAFDLRQERQAIRDSYGAGHRGACYLVGRKLIEAGVKFVTVDCRWPKGKDTPEGAGNLNWDHHDHIYAKQTCELPGATGAGAGRYGIAHWVMMGSTDQAFAALITDLDQRGLLDETLVCFVSEFGRTPRINKAKGRDHWTHAYTTVFAGAGTRGGQVIGKTDKEGGYVLDQPHTPEDYASTIYEKLGIDRSKPIYMPSNRPVFFGHAGEPIAEVM